MYVLYISQSFRDSVLVICYFGKKNFFLKYVKMNKMGILINALMFIMLHMFEINTRIIIVQ